MTTLSLALADAGVKTPPLNERVWNCLHDSKLPRSGKVISQMLNVKSADVSSALSVMLKRGMVSVDYQTDSIRIGRGYARREVAYYRAVGSSYELRPLPVKPGAAPVMQPPVPKALRADDIDLESMKLSEAHSLYKRLREFFA